MLRQHNTLRLMFAVPETVGPTQSPQALLRLCSFRNGLLALVFFICAVFVPADAMSAPAAPTCDRLCKAETAIRYSPGEGVLAQLEMQLEDWASMLLATRDAPIYLTYMDSYQLLAAKDLNEYAARYVRRKLRSKPLNELYQHMTALGGDSLQPMLVKVLTTDKAQVDEYVQRLMWVRMRETRRYLIRRLDEVYGLSRMSYLLYYQSRQFVGQYMLQQAERWSLNQPLQADPALQNKIDRWLMEDIDIDPEQFQTANYHEVIQRMTYVLRNVDDQTLRQAIDYYQHPQYQEMLALIEKAWSLHFQRLRVKNSLSDQGSSVR